MKTPDYYFAVDVMRHVGKKYNLICLPEEEPNPLSPFNEFAAKGIDSALEEWSPEGIRLYHEISGTIFKKRFRFVARLLVDFGIELGKDFLYVCTAVAEIATEYFKNGQLDAPLIAIEAIERCVLLFRRMYGNNIFRRFDQDFSDSPTSEFPS